MFSILCMVVYHFLVHNKLAKLVQMFANTHFTTGERERGRTLSTPTTKLVTDKVNVTPLSLTQREIKPKI